MCPTPVGKLSLAVEKEHQIRFENSPVLAESLYLDGGLVARGGVGRKMELRAPIRAGEDTGAEIVALVDAKTWSFRLRLFVQSPNPATADVEPTTNPSSSGPSESATTTHPTTAATDSEATQTETSSVLGQFRVAKEVIELVSAVIGLIGGISTLAGWFS